MRNTPTKTQKTKSRFSAFTLHVCLFTFSFLLACGCGDSLQRNYIYLDVVSVNELLPEATQIIQESLADDDPRVRTNAIEVVAASKQVKFMPKVERLLQDDYVPVRFAAALAIGDFEYSFAKSSVKRLLEDEDENVRIAADYAMSKLGSGSGFELVRKAIASEDQKVRANAALLLGKSGDKEGLKFLWWALGRKGSDDKVRLNAVEAIAMLGDERIYPKVWATLINTYGEDRITGVRAMGTLGTTEAKSALITMLDDDMLEVRLVAAEQLGMLGDTAGEPEVLDVFTKNLTAGLDKKGLERVNKLTVLAIGQIGTSPLTKFLPQFLKDESKFVRIAAAKAVFQCGPET